MSYIRYNPNPKNQRVGDCTVRALCKALDRDWESMYIELVCEGLKYCDMPSSNYVWGMLLRRYGYVQKMVPSICHNCTTVQEFTKQNPIGTFVLACQNHVVTAKDGNYYDSWDSGEEVVLYFWQKED